MTATSASAPGRNRRTSRPVVLFGSGARKVGHPQLMGRHQTPGGIRCFGVADLISGWVTIGSVAALVLAAVWIAHIPRGAVPSIPRWLWVILALGFVTAALAGGGPVVSIDGVNIWLGGTLNFLRITALSVVLLGLGAMVSWTTNVAEIAPALAILGRPLNGCGFRLTSGRSP